MQTTSIICRFVLLCFFFISCTPQEMSRESQPVDSDKRPNIIFILTDDLGYGDLGVLFQNQRKGSEKPSHLTPQLDSLAMQGMLLTRHYVPAPVCAPSRASLLMGLHQGHAEIRNNQFDKALPDNHTLASVLKEAGYATALVGKYGLQGLEGNSPESWEAYPTKRGFDYFLGYVRHRDGHNHYPAHEAPARPPVELYAGNDEISGRLQGVYTTDLFTAAAKHWITEQEEQNPDQPFFLYLAYDTPHAGLQVAASPYPQQGVQWIGDSAKYINTVEESIDDYIHPDYAGQEWPEQYRRFASMVRRIDNGVGDLVQMLEELNIDDETLIVFSSDNGPHHESYGYGAYNPTFFESFGPLDGTKRDTWEGGIRVPTLVYWPGQVTAGERDDTPSQFHDWMATFAEAAGVAAPANTDGVSLMPVLLGQGKRDQGEVYVEYFHNGPTREYQKFDPSHRNQYRGEMQVIYLEGYKGVRYDIKAANDNFRIYDTQKDPGELNDLAGSSAFFNGLQQRMKNKVLRMRRTNASAGRPYDSIPVPALAVEQKQASGLQYQTFKAASSWVPDTASPRAEPVNSGTVEGFDSSLSSREENVVAFSGLLNVPQTGTYTFSLQTEGAAVLHLHDALLIDADKGYAPGTAVGTEIMLEQGLHPIKLVYMSRQQDAPELELQWDGPGLDRQKIASDYLRHLQAEG